MNVLKGIIPRTFNQIIAVTKSQINKKHLITCSFIEIYNENVHDLLGEDIKANLSVKESQNKGLVIEGLKSFIVKSVEELERFLKIGYKNRSVRQTTMNKESSRSHCIFSIKVEEETTDEYGNTRFRVGKLNLVDLAGS
jgi:kinesin family member 17